MLREVYKHVMSALPNPAKNLFVGAIGGACLAKTFCDQKVEIITLQTRLEYQQKEFGLNGQIQTLQNESAKKELDYRTQLFERDQELSTIKLELIEVVKSKSKKRWFQS